ICSTITSQHFIAGRGRGENYIVSNAVHRDGYLERTASKDRATQTKRRIRKFTPRECERLQGFPDDWTAMGDIGKISNSQRIKCLGNAVTVNVIRYLAEKYL
ncbi:MAG: DNA cytosine methyltransferase, partial [Bdellovibrionales bacterium]|nr:DNA cytosine methyltransferase [Bdellovibrionales bacterium]